MLSVDIRVIPHAKQRYPTVGDWQWDGDKLTIFVSDLGDWKKEALIADHEFKEALLARSNGVTTADVDAFDMAFEARRESGNIDEPGMHPMCPVYKEHIFCTGVEMIFALMLGVDWASYNKQVEEL